jgi:hypothetical protein
MARETAVTRRKSRVNLSLGVIGITGAAVLIYPKAALLLAGDLSVLGVGAVANLALLFGSLMFLRNAQMFRRQLHQAPGTRHQAPIVESRTPNHGQS